MNVLGIGNALVDIITLLKDDSVLKSFGLPKGSMTLVDRELSNFIHAATSELPNRKASGGSAANTIHGLAHMGLTTAFIGKIGNDELGQFFRKDMQINKIKTILYNSFTDTGRAVALVSPDSERTFATYLGASDELLAEDLTSDIFTGYDLFYVEGYLVQNRELIDKALHLARTAGLTVCLDLASYNIVRDNAEFLMELLRNYVDIVFANEEEVKALLGHEPHKAIKMLAEICETAVVKIGAKGSLIMKGREKIEIEAVNSTPVDTTGAGDLYASGFIYGLSQNASLFSCGHIGSILAGKVIEVLGAKMEESTWDVLRKDIDKYLLSR
jgi:sugar/nucleoside kinase (ribokinase family)